MIEPRKPIRDVIAEMAVASAMSDPRFKTLEPQELGNLHIEVSILSSLRPIAPSEEIRVGHHGLVVRKGASSGLLLPQVAEERGWDAVEFLESTCEKAGLPPGSWKDDTVQIYVFTATVFGEEKEFTH